MRRGMDDDLALGGLVILWVTAGVLLDRGASRLAQDTIGLATWVLLVVLLRRETPLVRLQVLAAVAIATVGEIVLALELELYTYRLSNLPLFVPPGHGIVYLAALALARSAAAQARSRALELATMATALCWGVWGVTASARQDLFGAVLALCFAGFVVAGRAPTVYACAFIVTSWLELAGTAAGTWTWARADASGWLTLGNPPSGIAAGYCLLDCAALSAGTRLSRRVNRLRAASIG